MPVKNPNLMVKCIASLLILAICNVSHAQWKKAETLTGGAIVSDIISFNGDVYVAMVSAGIFKSSDEGDTWTRMAVPAQPNFTYFASTGSNLLAISYGKTFSTTTGDVWTEGAGPDAFINDVSSEGLNIAAATTNGVYQSTDGGTTWIRNPDVQTHNSIKSILIKGNNIWAGLDAAAGTLFKSDNGGSSWGKTVMGTKLIRDIVTAGTDIFLNIPYDGIYKSSNQGVDWTLVRNLENSEGKLHAATSGLYYFSHYKLYSSTNAGNTWLEKSQLIPLFNFQTIYATADHILVGLWGGGVVRTTIAGNNNWELVNTGIAVHQVNDLIDVGSTIHAGLEDSFIRSSTNEGQTWDQKKDTYNLFAGSGRALHSAGSQLYVGSGGGGVQRSSDNGATWVLKNDGLVSKNILDFASTGNAIFAGTDDGVYASANNGDNWTKKTGEMAMVRTLHGNGNVIYAGTYDGLFESSDVGETWTRISTALPDQSVSAIANLGSVLFAATQFNGLYQTPDSGNSWEKVNSEYVQDLAVLNNHLFISTLDGELLISADSGKTAEDIAASLPSGIVTAITFTEENIFIGKGSEGVWTRKLTEILPPYLTLYSDRNNNTFNVDGPLYVASDQVLYSSGTEVSEGDITSFISIETAEGGSTEYTAQINAEKKLITLNITGAVEGEVYTVSIGSVENVSGLASPRISKAFTAIVNRIPVVSNVVAEGEHGEIVSFNEEMFLEAFSDEDGDQLVNFRIKALPSHGILKLNDVSVTLEQVIPVSPFGELTYTPESNFTGTDEWYWNGSDGMSYSAIDAKVTIHIAPVMGLVENSSPFRLYPNPVASTLRVDAETTDAYNLKVLDMNGCPVIFGSNGTLDLVTRDDLDLTDLPAGIYIVVLQSGSGQEYRQKIIKL